MKEIYKDKLKLLYTNMDILIYDTETEDLYDDMKNTISLYDTSDYPKNNRFSMAIVN